MKGIYYILPLLVCLLSCSKRPGGTVQTNPETPQVKLQFSNVVDGEPLVLKTQTYTNAYGNTYQADAYKYYISNIKFTSANGKEFSEPESYHLIDQEMESTLGFTIKDIPEGNYTKIRFLVGVDSIRNSTGAQTGALDPANGMIWDWNTGYIMAKLEGRTPHSDSKYITFHLGGYKGENSVLRYITLDLPGGLTITKDKIPVIHIQSDVAEWFKTPYTINFENTSIIMSAGSAAAKIADNYSDMFSITKVEQ